MANLRTAKTKRERDDAWHRSHQTQISKRKEMLIADGMDPDRAESKASRDQESVTNRARALVEAGG